MSVTVMAALDRRVEVIDGAQEDRGAIRRVNDLRAFPYVVLLGEPGIGKSTVLQGEATVEGVPVLNVRELMTGSVVESGGTLILDALDEYRVDGQPADKIHGLGHAMARARPARWRLSCRSEDWRKEADLAPVAKTTSGGAILVAQLLPLDRDEAASVLVALGEPDPERFLARAEALGAAGFIESPLSLKLLHMAVRAESEWPRTRFELFASAIRRLTFEPNVEHKWRERSPPDAILTAAADACLVLLASGARAIWRSNDQPPAGRDARAYVPAHDLGLARDVLNDALDTALFRGEGEAFEPMHRTVAEFLAGEALARAMAKPGDERGLPLARAVALVAGSDGAAPTELRGVYAWFAAHLMQTGDEEGALRLIEADAATVLAYGDAGAFSSGARRAIFNNLDRNDPYFRVSGLTTVGALAGDDLAEDFALVLRGRADGTDRLLTVFEALTHGTPIPSLKPLLRELVLDAGRPEWQRRRAAEAYVNGSADPAGVCRELYDALAGEPVSMAREALRVHLAARLPKGSLSASDVITVLSDYLRTPDDNMVGRLFALKKRLEAEPLRDLFDEPVRDWMPDCSGRRNDVDVELVLDHALAGAIGATPDLSADRIWRWTVNARDDVMTELRGKASIALTTWLDRDPKREAALFDAILAEDDPATEQWSVRSNYIVIARRNPSAAIVRSVLRKAAADPKPDSARRLLAIAVDAAARLEGEADEYWDAYDAVERAGADDLLKRLTVVPLDTWRAEREREERSRLRHAKVKADNVRALAPDLADMRMGRRADRLHQAAGWYFGTVGAKGGEAVGIERVVDLTDEATTEAYVAGWEHLATIGLGSIRAAELGRAEGEGRYYCVEAAALAGVDRLLADGRVPETAPMEVALAVLKSSWNVPGGDRRTTLERWGLERLNRDPAAGAAMLLEFWCAALDAGSPRLNCLWRIRDDDARGPAVEQAIAALLDSRRGMPPEALRAAVACGAWHLSRSRLLGLAEAALADATVTGRQRRLWSCVAFVLDPVRHADRFIGEHDGERAIETFEDDMNDSFFEAFGQDGRALRRHRDVMAVRLLGKAARPQDDRPRGGRGNAAQLVMRAINVLATDSDSWAATCLSDLAADPALAAWTSSLRHARAQQAGLRRDATFIHPKPAAVRAAIAGGAPVNAGDLRAVVMDELGRLRADLRTTDTTPWKRYWNLDANGRPVRPLIENQCRDNLLDRLRDRLAKYGIAAALPEARRGEETRTDMLVLTGAGRNLPIEVKRHFHSDIWTAASTQLQGYASDPGAELLGIYLVFWFGNEMGRTPARPDGAEGPTSAVELEEMLVTTLPSGLRKSTDVVVFDVSDPEAAVRARPRRRRRMARPAADE